MKKIFSYIYIIMVCLMLCGCSAKEYNYEGKELVDKALEIHTGYESADVSVYDNNLNETVQRIVYRFQGEVMQYMYSAYVDGKTYYEFNNGTELNYITLPDQTEWSFIAKGEENFYSYSKASRHYFADGDALFADYGAAVSESIVEDKGEQYAVILNYDESKLSQYDSLAAYGEFSDFSVQFWIDKKSGGCIKYVNDYTLSDGTNQRYTIWIFERNPDNVIERTEIE